jgi:hypothetical protein
MKSATGFPVRRRLSLHIRGRLRRIKALTGGAALLALCLAAPALAAVETNPEPLDRNPGATWVLVTGEPDEAPALPAPSQPTAQIGPPPDVLEAISVLRAACPRWDTAKTQRFATEGAVCALIVGNAPEATTEQQSALVASEIRTRGVLLDIMTSVLAIQADVAAARRQTTGAGQ